MPVVLKAWQTCCCLVLQWRSTCFSQDTIKSSAKDLIKDLANPGKDPVPWEFNAVGGSV